MTRLNSFLYSLEEVHIRLEHDGGGVFLEGFPEGFEHGPLPAFYHNGILAIYHMLESMIPAMVGISVMGVWSTREQDAKAPFCAFDVWVQSGPEEGFYLPVASAHSLFSSNGIPYFHAPVL